MQDRGERGMATSQFRQPLPAQQPKLFIWSGRAKTSNFDVYLLYVNLLYIVLRIIPDKCLLLGCTSTYKNAFKTNIINMYLYLDLLFENILINTLEQDSNDNINYYKHIST